MPTFNEINTGWNIDTDGRLSYARTLYERASDVAFGRTYVNEPLINWDWSDAGADAVSVARVEPITISSESIKFLDNEPKISMQFMDSYLRGEMSFDDAVDKTIEEVMATIDDYVSKNRK